MPMADTRAVSISFIAKKIKRSSPEATHAKAGDLVLIVAGAEERTRKAISALRLEMAERLGLRNPGGI